MLYEQLFIVPLVKQNIIVFAANNSRCCKCLVAPTIIWIGIVDRFFATQNHKKMRKNILLLTLEALTSRCYQHWQHLLFQTAKEQCIFNFGSAGIIVGADCTLQDNSRRYITFAAPTIISCKYYYSLLL
jgi:hypothetical protein